jgi:hypothetical protein
MQSAPSPTIEGFRVMFGRPTFGLAEITWRWCFGLAGWLLAGLSVALFLDTLPVSRVDLLLLKSRQPVLIAHGLSHIFRGSGARLVLSLTVLALALTLLWIVVAALGRAATVKALISVFRSPASQTARESRRWRMKAMVGLHFFRAMAFLAAVVACFAPFAMMRASGAKLDDGEVMVVGIATALLVASAWSVLNWFLSLAAIFVMSRGEDTFGAMGAAVDLCQERPGAVFAVGTWFGLAHAGAFTVATFLGLFAVGLFGALPAGVGSIALLAVTLGYFAVADFLYIGRMAAYVAMVESREMPVVRVVRPVVVPPAAVDRDELILSDVPGLA